MVIGELVRYRPSAFVVATAVGPWGAPVAPSQNFYEILTRGI